MEWKGWDFSGVRGFSTYLHIYILTLDWTWLDWTGGEERSGACVPLCR